nr:MAG TPA: hypothetical protein [Microviridae sp.]
MQYHKIKGKSIFLCVKRKLIATLLRNMNF